ncbi:MAG: NAD(FAD)-dependent dehydrogenase, partial [Thermoleophilia bacterium]|nr:NAD(FAD)-dependent dehydrogenase [Thermoleophilia bacterium]
MAAVAASPSAARRRILVVGGGVAGAETALTLALGLPEDEIVLVSRWPAVRVLPELVYVPFGVNPRRIDLPLDALATCGVRVVVAEVTSIDAEHRTVTTTKGVFEADVLIAAPGAQAIDGGHRSLRTLDDALRIRAELADTCARAAAGERRSIVIRSAAEHA